ncbi:Serine/threonine protein kinase [Phytophthora megakarya]|uniref:Serine/threonine protein kinase n=1 Tax=Phytophthora megakarya TaxID=4795 RepID=A0A225W1L7_9STRA|nr:Serine/threonine protein kinase [Phytophthora megakarya]
MVKNFCMVIGAVGSFPVDIDERQSVRDLKKTIADELTYRQAGAVPEQLGCFIGGRHEAGQVPVHELVVVPNDNDRKQKRTEDAPDAWIEVLKQVPIDDDTPYIFDFATAGLKVTLVDDKINESDARIRDLCKMRGRLSLLFAMLNLSTFFQPVVDLVKPQDIFLEQNRRLQKSITLK